MQRHAQGAATGIPLAGYFLRGPGRLGGGGGTGGFGGTAPPFPLSRLGPFGPGFSMDSPHKAGVPQRKPREEDGTRQEEGEGKDV
jgi:hypothetical protein